MSSINKVILIGNLGADPEMRYLPNGDAACSLRLATSSQWRDKTSGDTREATEWHRVVLFRRLAEVANDYLKKGAPVYLEGRIRTRRWQDKDGKEHFTTEIEATEMKMLSSSLSDTLPKSGTKTEPVPQTIANRTSTDRFGDVPF